VPDSRDKDDSVPAPVAVETAAASRVPDGVLEAKAGESGSIDVAMSGPLPKPPVLPDGAVVEPASVTDSAPVSSGRVTSMHAAATGPTAAGESSRSKRITDVGKDILDKGMTSLGSGLETIGGGVSKLGEASKKVPMVGGSIARLGEGVIKLGESITDLPRVARTRRGALLVRSLLVGFILVFSWIAIIVMLQVQGTDSPDFRPYAERILAQISSGKPQIEELYEKASPRFQEIVRKERFVDEMLDLNATCGKFVEISAVNDSFVSSGPTGRIGRMSTMVQYARGKTRAAVSLHWLDGEWKLLGVSVEVPPELEITQAQREERVTPCDSRGPDGKRGTDDDIPNSTMNTTKCDVHVISDRILEHLRDGKAAEVWDAANREVFQKQEQRAKFIELSRDQQRVLGEYRRIIVVTEAKIFSGKEEERAYFDVIAEYSRANVRVIFGLTRPSKSLEWQLRSLKIALPMPRIDDLARATSSSVPPGPKSEKPATSSGSQQRPGAGSQRPQRPVPRANSGSGSAATTGSGSSGSGSGS